MERTGSQFEGRNQEKVTLVRTKLLPIRHPPLPLLHPLVVVEVLPLLKRRRDTGTATKPTERRKKTKISTTELRPKLNILTSHALEDLVGLVYLPRLGKKKGQEEVEERNRFSWEEDIEDALEGMGLLKQGLRLPTTPNHTSRMKKSTIWRVSAEESEVSSLEARLIRVSDPSKSNSAKPDPSLISLVICTVRQNPNLNDHLSQFPSLQARTSPRAKVEHESALIRVETHFHDFLRFLQYLYLGSFPCPLSD